MKKILALACSPSRGWNSETMLDSFLEGARMVPGIEIKKVALADVPIAMYDYEHKRVDAAAEPAFAALCEDVKSCAGLVIATPTYNFSVPGHLKNFVDRISSISLDYKNLNAIKQPTGQLGSLKTFFLVTGGTPAWAQKLLFPLFPPFWLSIIFKYFGARLGGSIFGGNMKASSPAKDDAALLARCRQAGRRYALSLLQ